MRTARHGWGRWVRLALLSAPLALGVAGAWLLPRAAASDPQARYLLVGGAGRPAQTQASLEAHVDLLGHALRTRGEHGEAGPLAGTVLFGAGPGELPVVQEEREHARGDDVRALLAEVFGQSASWGWGYRTARLAPLDGAADRATLLAGLRREAAAAGRGGTLLFYFTGHGSVEAEPQGATLWLWGDEGLSLRDLATALDELPPDRAVVSILTQCHSGGFAGLYLAGGDAEAEPARGCRCGFFATVAEKESTGCTPSPRRAEYDDYSTRLAEALSGERAAGGAAPSADLDGDGRIALAEAHAYARLRERSVDVPTCSSEHWLRAQASPHGQPVNLESPLDMLLALARPGDRAVLAGLSERLLPGAPLPVLQARYRSEQISLRIESLRYDAQEAVAEREAVVTRLISALSARWPLLEEPWHPDFPARIARDGAAVRAHLLASPDLAALRRLDREVERLDDLRWKLLEQQAGLDRLLRAAENVALEWDLRQRDPQAAAVLDRLYACEAWVPGEPANERCAP